MSQTTIALVILAVTLVLYMIPTVPISVTTLPAMLAMSVTGIISFSDTFAGFANSATLLVAGMMIIGHACFTSGLAATLGNNMTTISATSMITAVGLLTAAGYEEIGLFAPTIINLPAVAIIVIMYGMVGHKLQTKWFDFDEIDIDHTALLISFNTAMFSP